MTTRILLILSFSVIISACGDTENNSAKEEETPSQEDSIVSEEIEVDEPINIDAIQILVPPFELSVSDETEISENNSILNLSDEIREDIELNSEWMHPTGFWFEDGINTTLIGQIKDENFNVYVSFSDGYEGTMAGYFEAQFYYISVYDLNGQLLDQEILSSNERLKDGGMGHHYWSTCRFNEGLSYSIETTSYEYDFEDGEDFESESTNTFYYQIQTDGTIEMIPE